MFFLLPISEARPSLLEKNKDESYHCKFARYCIGQANTSLHSTWIDKIQKNKRFYGGDQWTNQEDIDTFLKDEDGQDRNRLAMALNIMRPIVEQYRGNAIRMNINFTTKSISPRAVNRREIKLAKMRHLTKVANQPGNPFGPMMKKKFPVGDSEAETEGIFQNIYVDEYVQNMNYLAKFVSERNKFSNKQISVAMNLCFTGLGVIKDFEYAGHQQFRVTPSETFFWDRSAKEPDLTDAFTMGDVEEMFPTEIFEQAQDLRPDQREAIEAFSIRFSGGSPSYIPGRENTGQVATGKVPVYNVYWRDGQFDEYGYVKDEYGYEYFTKINYTYEGEDKPRYTDKDLIKSNSILAKKRLGTKLKTKVFYDVLRMARFIPKEILASADTSNNDKNKYNDVMLDWGIAPYQEVENQEYNTVKFPYKCYTWAYIDGEVLSPMDDSIDPQRFINRIFSMTENQLNNMPGAGPVIDEDLLSDSMDKSEAERNIKQSRPIWLRTKGRGVQNAIGQYTNHQTAGASENMFNIINIMKASNKETTGVNDAIQGQATGNGNDQLVGVTQLQIERGSLMQEPFYYAITNIFEQCFNAICCRGKRIYADNERELTIAVGDEGAKIIRISKDMLPEDFRTFVKRENSDEILIQTANQQLMVFKQFGMLDDERIADLWGRSTPDQVANALRSYAREKKEISRMAQKDQAAQEQQLMGQAQQEQAAEQQALKQQQDREDMSKLMEIDGKKENETIKNLGKLAGKNPAANKLIIDSAKNLQTNNI